MKSIKRTTRRAKMLAISATLFLFLTASAQTAAPTRLQIGDSSIDGSVIKPFSAKWQVTNIKPDGTKAITETASDEMFVTTFNGKPVLKEVQRPLSGSQHGVLINLVDLKTLAPHITQHLDDSDGSYILTEYKDGHVDVTCSGKLCPRDLTTSIGEVARKSVKVENPVFDFWGGFYGMLLAGLPLKEGYAVSIPAYHPLRGLIWLKLSVEGEEMVAIGGGKQLKAWAVRAPQTPFVFYISKEAPYWVKLIETRPDGNKFIYERV